MALPLLYVAIDSALIISARIAAIRLGVELLKSDHEYSKGIMEKRKHNQQMEEERKKSGKDRRQFDRDLLGKMPYDDDIVIPPLRPRPHPVIPPLPPNVSPPLRRPPDSAE